MEGRIERARHRLTAMQVGSRMLEVRDLSGLNGENARRAKSPRKVVLSYRIVRQMGETT